MSRRLAAVAAAAVALLIFGATNALAGHRMVHLTGTIDRYHSDDFRTERDHTYLALTTDGPAYRLVFGKHRSFPVGSLVSVAGMRIGHVLHVKSARLAGFPPHSRGLDSATATPTGTHKVAVLMFNFTNDTRQPYTADQLRSAVFTGTTSANAYLQEASHGLLSLAGKVRSDGDVFGWYTIPYATTSCQFSVWASAARAAAQSAGVDLSGYDHLVYYFPNESTCAWGGMADTPGSNVWINGSVSYRSFSHELGHNLGFFHASSDNCTDATGARVSLSATCTRDEYGDPFDVMGAGSYEYSNWHKAQLGWLAGAAQTVTSAGTYALSPEEQSAGTTLIRVPRGATGTYLYLEYHQPYGTFDNFPATSPLVTGVVVRVAPDYGTFTQSLLVDCTPATTTFNDAPLPVGRSLVDSASGVTITTVSTGLLATVSISIGGSAAPTPDTVPPSAPTAPVAQATTTSVSLSWVASTDNVGVAGYKIYRDGVASATSTATSFSDTAVSAGQTHSYFVAAYDAAGNVSAASPSVSVTLPQPADTTPPTAPANVVAAASSPSAVSVSWSASSDNVGIARYDVYRNGVKVGSATTTAYTDAGLGAGTYVYDVVAFDAAGNASAASSSATATLSAVDSTPPAAPAWVQAQAMHGPAVSLSWAAANDNVGVASYHVYRNGTLVTTTPATSLVDTGLSGATAYSYYVVAVDASGNVGGPSPSVTVTTRKK